MTNDELKKKIVEILVNCKSEECAVEYCADCEGNPCIENCREKQQADALIAAGIGDVKDVEAEANRYEMLYKLQNRDMALAERRAHDAEHRAEVAERALLTVCTNIVTDEEDDLAVEPRARVLYKAYLKQAEKEFAEERKDD